MDRFVTKVANIFVVQRFITHYSRGTFLALRNRSKLRTGVGSPEGNTSTFERAAQEQIVETRRSNQMKTRFKTMSSALALTFILLFSAAAFAHTANTSVANPNISAAEMASARNERWKNRRHRRHMRRYVRRERREMRREKKENR